MVPRRLRLVRWSEDSGCPDNGSKINGLDLASTAFSSPSVNNVPTRLPSRPSRAISTASPIRDSRTSASYSVTWQRMLSNIHQTPSLWIAATHYTHTVLDEAITRKIQALNDNCTNDGTFGTCKRIGRSRLPGVLSGNIFRSGAPTPHRSLGGRVLRYIGGRPV